MHNKLINVMYHGRTVGRLAETPQKEIAFEYDADWLRGGFSISPFKLPLEKRVFIAQRNPFDGNFGVFNDSLPDGWGRLLIDRMLLKKHIDPFSISTLDRLSIVGSSGMGALEYKPETLLVDDITIDDINILAHEAEAMLHEVYDGRKLEELVKLGGSSVGARPKILLDIKKEGWLIKFRASVDPKNIGKQEFDYMEAARASGIEVPQIKLFEGKYFGVKRFDREADGKKVFMISACGLLDSSHRYPTLDYNNLMSVTLELTRDFREAEKMFRLMCFNVFAHNRDDHSKNFSFLFKDGNWFVSPAYDITYTSGMGGEHATTIDGEGRNPGGENILSVAKKSGMNQRKAKNIMHEVKIAVEEANLAKYWR
ncbi:MAG: type II toxin-antitoxin system HipA family toxin [Treponema sp.]|nr:type II toxin-antitoxin system HipA family toxin [Treponema sp.]